MSRLQSRLRKLEAVMTVDRGLIPHSPRWLDYWTSQLDRLCAGEELAECIPLEAVDAILAASKARDAAQSSGALKTGMMHQLFQTRNVERQGHEGHSQTHPEA